MSNSSIIQGLSPSENLYKSFPISIGSNFLPKALAKLGHEIVGEAEDGDKAVQYFTSLKPDVVFLDLILPGKSGIEVLEDLRRVDPKTRIVVITAVDQVEIDRRLSGKNIHAIIRKPFSFGDFKTLMASLI